MAISAHKPRTFGARPPQHKLALKPVQAAKPDKEPEEDVNALKQKFFASEQSESPNRDDSSTSDDAGLLSTLDDVNPLVLGRRARRAFDDIWGQVSRLASPTKTYIFDDEFEPSRDFEDESPQARFTTVLVIGATGRVGRVLVRKLLLRGYKVKALVRKVDVASQKLPPAVELIEGDVGEQRDCQKAVRDVNKVIYAAASRSTFTGELVRVEERGVMNVTKALQDEFYRRSQKARAPFSSHAKKEVADFNAQYHQLRWDVTYVGDPLGDRTGFKPAFENNRATAVITEQNNLLFEGQLYQRGAIAEVGAPMDSTLPKGEHRTSGTEGLALRIKGDGHIFTLVVRTERKETYSARFLTRPGYLTVRLPFTAFRCESKDKAGPLKPETIASMAIRFENRAKPVPQSGGRMMAPPSEGGEKFALEVDWIKALPGGSEPDLVMVSCAGQQRPDMEAADMAKMLGYKRQGEENLRLSGLGYTIIRPGTLVEEPGGYRALVFDQGSRISETISAADVADICLRALHESAARNKTFDVCYEYRAEEDTEMYELVATMPDKSNNYLKLALSNLQKNT